MGFKYELILGSIVLKRNRSNLGHFWIYRDNGRTLVGRLHQDSSHRAEQIPEDKRPLESPVGFSIVDDVDGGGKAIPKRGHSFWVSSNPTPTETTPYIVGIVGRGPWVDITWEDVAALRKFLTE